jgi:RNA recognition motif-containing protein
MNIYVGNLPYSMKPDDLRKMFAEFGEVAEANLIMDKFSGQTKGFGFVEMPSNSEADAAIKALNKRMMDGRAIKVNQAEKRDKKPSRGPRW